MRTAQLPMVEEALRLHGPCDKHELHAVAPFACLKQIERHLRRLQDQRRAHIMRWERSTFEGRSYPRPVWKHGPGPNAKKPRSLTPAEVASRYRARNRVAEAVP